jgi:serine/threonine protein kinase
MAKPQEIVGRVGFKRVQLLKKNTLGIGSYGKVCLAKCDDLLCAAKLLHETLFDPTSMHLIAPEREHRLPIRRFEKECGYLNTIRHPNIVQCLCIFEDTDTGLPVLLMELMDNNLTHFLEKGSKPVSYHIQVNICRDITFALSYLHSNDIIHRDLSSNNVLLIGNVRAKLSDFGMAKLSDTGYTFTMCPGTDVYMPPESVEDKPLYTETMDCFSFGVIIVQILTQQFPQPSDRNKIIEIYHPQVKGRKVKVSVPEVERRQNHISLVDPSNTLLHIAFDCLKDQFNERPSAQKLCEYLMGLKETSEYHKSERETETFLQTNENELKLLRVQHTQEVKSLQEIIKIQQKNLDEKSQTIADMITDRNESIRADEEEIIQLSREITRTKMLVNEKDLILEEKERLLKRASQQLEISEHTIADFGRQIQELEQQLSQEKQIKRSEIRSGTPVEHKTAGTIKIRWTKGKRAPCKVSGPTNAALHTNAVYIKPPGKIVYVYSLKFLTWARLPCCPTSNCSLVVVNDLLTLVGGYDKDCCTNRLFSLTGEGSGNWSQEFPSMPTKRYGVAALFTGIALTVAGGVGEDESVLTLVEVLNTENNQWSAAASLLDPLVNSLAAVCDGQVYMVGGEDAKLEPTKRVYTCELTALLESINPRSKAGRFNTLRRSNKAKVLVWNRVADVPMIQPACAFLHGCLLAIGGRDSEHRPSTAVHAYVPTNNTWEIISHMVTPRYNCFAAILPDNQVMVIGGITDKSRTKTDTVEMGSLLKLIIT